MYQTQNIGELGQYHFHSFQNSDGNVKRVFVNEEEYYSQSRSTGSGGHIRDSDFEILHAKSLGGEIESGKIVIPMNISVAKFVLGDEESNFIKGILGFSLQPAISRNFPKVESMVLYDFTALGLLKRHSRMDK